jgi:hypothetical protein
MSHRRFAVVAGVLVLATAGTALGQSVGQRFADSSPEHRYFRIDSSVISGKRGPEIEGYVYNLSDMQAVHVRVAVESLDASGQKIGERTVYVPLDIPPRVRSYFRVPVPAGTASTRNEVIYYEWSPRGGGA